jgi:hypothetical protein
MRQIALVSLVFFASFAAALEAPVMPKSFIATFTNPPGVDQPLLGSWFYDFDRQTQLVIGGNQASCNRVKAGQYCLTYLNQTTFFVVFPFSRMCCTEAAPGLLSPDWLRTDNATFVGTETVGTRTCDVWLAIGGSKNYYLAERSTGFMCRLDDGGFNWTTISWQAGPIDPAVLTIPEYCRNAPACP